MYRHALEAVTRAGLDPDDVQVPENAPEFYGEKCVGTWAEKDLSGEKFFD